MPDQSENTQAKTNDDGSPRDASRPQQAGEAATTRFGMEEEDEAEAPATGTDPERQSPDKE
jgi:hypothetical protein